MSPLHKTTIFYLFIKETPEENGHRLRTPTNTENIVLMKKTFSGRATRVVAYNGHRLRTPTNTENMVLLRKTSGGRAKRVVAYDGH